MISEAFSCFRSFHHIHFLHQCPHRIVFMSLYWTRLLFVFAMVKCAAVGCRSGYALTKADQKLVEAGKAHQNVSVFAFPKCDRQDIRDQWLSALKRGDTNWNPDHCGVCELHFRHEDFVDATYRKTPRQRKILKPSAVPSIFDCYPR